MSKALGDLAAAVAGAAAGCVLAWATTGALEVRPALPAPAGQVIDSDDPGLAPACAETLQGCPTYSHGPADGTLAETASTH